MGGRSVAEKSGIKAGWRAHFVGAPAEVLGSLGLPDLDVSEPLKGEFDYVHLFVVTQEGMRATMPGLVPHRAAEGKLWVSWPKAHRLGSDLSLPMVIEIGYDCGLVESTCLRVDETWAWLRFTRPKPGKTCASSYGTLPGSTRPTRDTE